MFIYSYQVPGTGLRPQHMSMSFYCNDAEPPNLCSFLVTQILSLLELTCFPDCSNACHMVLTSSEFVFPGKQEGPGTRQGPRLSPVCLPSASPGFGSELGPRKCGAETEMNPPSLATQGYLLTSQPSNHLPPTW